MPAYFEQYTVANKHGPVNTGSDTFNAICNSLVRAADAAAVLRVGGAWGQECKRLAVA